MLSPEVSLTNNEIVFVGFGMMHLNITGMILKIDVKGKLSWYWSTTRFFTQDLRFQRHYHDLLWALDL